jgi:hypothetical protein
MTRFRALAFVLLCAFVADADTLVTNRVHVTWSDAQGNTTAVSGAAEAAFLVGEPPRVASIRARPANTLLTNGGIVLPNTSAFSITFSEAVLDPAGDASAIDVTNPKNYRLIDAGTNGIVETISCAQSLQGDDVAAFTGAVTYDAGTQQATLNAGPLARRNHRLLVCSAGIQDLANVTLNNGADESVSFAVAGAADVPSLDPMSLALLALMLGIAGWFSMRRG